MQTSSCPWKAGYLVSLASALLAVGAVGCAGDDAPPAEASADDALSAPCNLATACGAGLSLLKSATFASGATSSGHTRADLTFTFAPNTGSETHAVHPRAIRRTTTGWLTAKAGLALHLAGDIAGAAPCGVDDNILVEVLDANGAITGSLLAGNGNHTLKRGDVTIAFAGPNDWQKDRYVIPANAIDLAPLVPHDKSFRLRVSALDHGGSALVSNVFLVATTAPVPPPPPPPAREIDLQDPGLAAAHTLSTAEATAFFAAAQTSASLGGWALGERRRTCDSVTGCTGWTNNDKTVLYGLWHDSTQAQPQYGPVARIPMAWTGDAALVVVGATISLRPRVTASAAASPGCALGAPCGLSFLSDPDCDPFGWGSLYCAAMTRTFTTKDRAPLAFDVRFGAGFYIGRTPTYREAASPTHFDEVEFVLYGRTHDGENAKLAVDGGRLLARW